MTKRAPRRGAGVRDHRHPLRVTLSRQWSRRGRRLLKPRAATMPGRGAEPARDAHAERDGAPSVVEGGRRAVRRLHLLWRHAYDTNVTGLSGMVAFNLLLSIFPFALLVLFVVGKLAQSESVEASIVRELQRLFPHAAGGTLHRTLATLRGQSTSIGIFAAVGNWAFPLYLTNISTIARFGATFALVLIVLVWFYAVALILLIGAVLNGSRLDR